MPRSIIRRARIEAVSLVLFAIVAGYVAALNQYALGIVDLPLLGFHPRSTQPDFFLAVCGLHFAICTFAAHRIARLSYRRLALAAIPIAYGLSWGYWADPTANALVEWFIQSKSFSGDRVFARAVAAVWLMGGIAAAITLALSTLSLRILWWSLFAAIASSVFAYFISVSNMDHAQILGRLDATGCEFAFWHGAFALVMARWAFAAAKESARRDPSLCAFCGYSLAGLPSRTCPECGHAAGVDTAAAG